jgi:hypothetical protein
MPTVYRRSTVPTVPWASFFRRYKFTHTDIHSVLETLAVAGEVLDLTAQYKELFLHREPWSTA